jgi:transcriptional regulator with XRE-family HTH domain
VNAHRNLRLNAKRLRLARGWSQEQLAEKAGLGYKHYQKIESGNWGDLYLKTVEHLADALKVTMGSLLDPPPKAASKPLPNLPAGRPKKQKR